MEITMKKIMISIAALCAVLFFVSCGGSSSESGDKGNSDETKDSDVTDSETADEEVTDSEVTDTEAADEETADTEEPDEPAEPEELAYPEVTKTSNKEGDIAQNITIYDDLDVEHKLAEWYKPNNPESKLVWLIFTTYDCAPCHQMKDDLPEINSREYEKQGLRIILVFNGLLEGPQPELEPEKLAEYKDIFVSEYPESADFEIYGYLRQEEQKVLKKFFSSPLGGAYPTYAFIDASTMEIIEYGEGWGGEMINSTKDKIEVLLEEL